MEPRTLNYLADACSGTLNSGAGDTLVRDVSTDSRSAGKDELFVAIRGDRFDGHEFVPEVLQRGGVGAVVDENFQQENAGGGIIRVSDTRAALGRMGARYRQDFDLPVIAIAGSNGKTSTKELLASVLRQKFPVLWSPASFNNDIGVPLTLLKLEKRHRAAVLEVGTNHPGELEPLIRIIDPQIGVLTSIGREHLEFFGDIHGVVREEGAIAEMLPADGVLFLNGDSEHAETIAARSKARVVRVGLDKNNPWHATNIRFEQGAYRFDLVSPEENLCGAIELKLLGRAQVGNALLAAAVGAHLGLTFDQIADGLRECHPPKMRMELMEFSGVQVLNDAYNANADSTRVALVTMAEMPVRGRRIVVLGDMAELGEHTHAAHLEVGRLAAELKIDRLIAVGDQAQATVDAAVEAGLIDSVIGGSIEGVVETLRGDHCPNDLILVKGSRSNRLERIIELLKSADHPKAAAT